MGKKQNHISMDFFAKIKKKAHTHLNSIYSFKFLHIGILLERLMIMLLLYRVPGLQTFVLKIIIIRKIYKHHSYNNNDEYLYNAYDIVL